GAGVSRPPFDHFNQADRCGDEPAAVAANRAALVAPATQPSAPPLLRQLHASHVVRLDSATTPDARADLAGAPVVHFDASALPEADASITSTPGTVLVVLTADCLPVVFAARDGSEVGVAHAGWRGLAAGVLEATVAAMRTPATGLEAWLGPAAGPAAYEVGDEVRQAFVEGRGAGVPGAAGAFVPTRPGHWLCDLYALARLRLAAAGIACVRGGGRCTIGEPDAFFSHRRDQRSGRQATLAWIA